MTKETTLLERPGRRDLLPEYKRFEDRGCRFHSACLTCPFETCKLEQHQGRIRAGDRRERVRQLRASGLSVSAIALELGVSRRTVFRLLALA